MRRVNVSLDTLDPAKFARITRWGRFAQVMDGIDAAAAAGLEVKINTVALKGVNDDELHDLVAWCGDRGFDLTFIEVMPMGDLGDEDRLDQYLVARRRCAPSSRRRWTLTDTAERTGGPARYVRVAETGGRIGFITPLTHNFCESCNRVRLTCTGQLYHVPRPGGRGRPARGAPRQPDDDAAVVGAIAAAIARKPKGHDFDYRRRRPCTARSSRHMSRHRRLSRNDHRLDRWTGES